MSRIFISYRRQDSEHAVGRLADDLRRHFAQDRVFQDIASIDPGADFIDALHQGLGQCAAVVVVIGPSWLSAADKNGRRRLDNPDDWVRQEIAESLVRKDVRVFPVLVGDADMPASEDLPEPLQALTRRQAYELTARHWPNDVVRLVEFLKRVPGLDRAPPPPPPPEPGNVPGSVFRDAPDGPEMVVVPAGSFLMGSPDGEEGRSADEGPQHKVTIARPFAVGKYAVTFDEWDAFVSAGGTSYRPEDEGWGRGRRPVINVSWDDAQEYVAWLSKKTGKTYRLLSEAEWEYAARAGTATRYPWGNDPGKNRANFDGSGSKWSNKQTAPVGSFKPNAFGLHNMIGNVWEWVQDCWNESYAGAPSDGSAWETGDCGLRVLRGGSWYFEPEYARAAIRSGIRPDYRDIDGGFRVARTL